MAGFSLALALWHVWILARLLDAAAAALGDDLGGGGVSGRAGARGGVAAGAGA